MQATFLRDLRHTIRELSVKLQKKIEKFPPRDSIFFFFFLVERENLGEIIDDGRASRLETWPRSNSCSPSIPYCQLDRGSGYYQYWQVLIIV